MTNIIGDCFFAKHDFFNSGNVEERVVAGRIGAVVIDRFEVIALIEDLRADLGDRGGDGHFCEAGAGIEGTGADGLYRFRDGDLG